MILTQPLWVPNSEPVQDTGVGHVQVGMANVGKSCLCAGPLNFNGLPHESALAA